VAELGTSFLPPLILAMATTHPSGIAQPDSHRMGGRSIWASSTITAPRRRAQPSEAEGGEARRPMPWPPN